MMGGALGLAVLAAIATARTDNLAGVGDPGLGALNDGYHAAFLVGGLFVAFSVVIGALLLRARQAPGGAHGGEFHGEPALEASEPSA
jgi:hypothetical protein